MLAGFVAAFAAMLVVAAPVHARTGMGDPAETFRDRQTDEWFVLDGHFRLRSALYSGMDLSRPASSDGSFLWPQGVTALDLTTGHDVRVRVRPTVFLGDEARFVLEVDLLDNVALGARPRFAPFEGRNAIVSGVAFQDPLTAFDSTFRIRSAFLEVLLPFGVLQAGRTPSHFGLGIAANAGDDLDDDLGDRADRIALVTPLFGHFVAAAFDVGASGPSGVVPGTSPAARSLLVGEQALSFSVMRFRAPWEVELLRDASRVVFDYGVAASVEWQAYDVPGFYQGLEADFGLDDRQIVRRDATAAVVDVWLRLVWGWFKVEAEGIASQFTIDNPSPFPGVELRTPITGNPWGAVVNAELRPVRNVAIALEAGAASGDPAPGFITVAPTSLSGARPGDVFGPQIDGKRDPRMDAFRLHPMYKVDLILWRTLLGGVSEAAYVRAHGEHELFRGFVATGNAIYSHALYAQSAPGGVSPLAVEVDAGFRWQITESGLSLRTDLGVLFPLGGLGGRAAQAADVVPATPAAMALVRLGHAF